MKVLIVEDDHNFAFMLKSSFLKAGHKVKLLFDGKQAVGFLNKSTPDLIVLDFYLPGHNAVELINELKSYPDTIDVPVLLYSAHADQLASLPDKVTLFDKTETTPKELAEYAAVNY